MGVGGSPLGRIVLEAAILRRVVRWGNNDAVSQTACPAAVVGEDRMRDHWGGCVGVLGIDHHIDFVGRQHFYSAMHLKSSFWGGFIQEMIHSDIGGLLIENRQGIPPTWGEFDVVAPQECDCHPSPPARALGSLGLHCRGAAGDGGGAAFGPQPRYRGILGPTLQRPWAHWPA